MRMAGELRGASGLGRNRWFLRLNEGKKAVRVQWNAIFANFEMKMGAGRAARLAKCTDTLAFEYNVSNLDDHF